MEPVRILLPPSEAKATGGTGAALRELGLGPAPLAEPRRTLITAVSALCAADPGRAADLLRIPPAVGPAAGAANAAMLDAPTLPALDRFTGVLFDAFGPGSLPRAARARAEESVLIFDGAFGALTGAEHVPDHRVPATATLPGLGGVTAFWRPVLAEALPAMVDGHLVVDLRSTDYAAMWRPVGPLREQVVPVRVLVRQESAGQQRHVVSSVPSKVGKGVLARALLRSRRTIRSPRDLVAVAAAAGFEVVPSRVGLDLLFAFVPKTVPPTRPG
jgi:cytoplasmic iron level regulating protein YaaA (DUF328/UPF0246 family)